MRALVAAVAVLALCGCADRERRNPLDPGGRNPDGDQAQALAAVAGYGRVDLTWDYSTFGDVRGYRLYRRTDTLGTAFAVLASVPPGTDSYVDAQVDNGVTYAYRLALDVEGEGERQLEPVEWATPGPEVAWVADRSSGLVWKVAADGRTAHFGRGRFFSLEGMALDRATGAVWVSDRFFAGLYRIDAQGQLAEHRAALDDPGPVAADPSGAPVWVVDRRAGQVKWFEWDAATDTLAVLAADASFAAVGGLAPQAGGCWISDPVQGRILYYHPQGPRIERTGLDRPGALAADSSGVVWALAAGGDELLRLDTAGGLTSVALQPGPGTALEVDPASGQVWVLGPAGASAYDAQGRQVQQFDGLEAPADLSLDAADGRVWVAGPTTLWKLTPDGQPVARLTGFSGLLEVAVDPQAGTRPGETP